MTVPARFRPALLVAIAATALTPYIAASATRLDTSRTVGIYALLSLSLGLCYGQAGILSAGQAAFAAIGAYATAIATRQYGLPVALGLVLAIVLPALTAYAVARLIVRLSPLALALATVVLGEILHHVLASGKGFTGGFIGISGIPSIPWARTPLAVHVVLWGTVALVVLGATFLVHSSQGRALRTIAHDQRLAVSLGIAVTARLSAVFALSGAVAGVAGWYYAHTTRYLAPESLPVLLSITVIIMVIVGGKRTVIGPVLGAILLTLLLDVLPRQAAQGLFYGAALVAVLLFFPDGLLGSKSVRRRVVAWRGRRADGGGGESGHTERVAVEAASSEVAP